MIFINNSSNFSLGIVNNPDADRIPLETGDLIIHIGTCLNMIPSKQLCRCLREVFMLRFEELQMTTGKFKDFVTELTILLARLDAEEDRKAMIKRNG